MSSDRFKWLLDTDLPRVDHISVDALHGSEISHLPGALGLTDSRALGRALVTCNREFLGPWEVPIGHPGLVIIDSIPTDGAAVERILLQLEFRLGQFTGTCPLGGNRFIVNSKMTVLQISADGMEYDLEPWKEVRLNPIGVFST